MNTLVQKDMSEQNETEKTSGSPLAPLTGSASAVRENAEIERWLFIRQWCTNKGISPMNADNFNRAAMEWAKLNCFKSNDAESDRGDKPECES